MPDNNVVVVRPVNAPILVKTDPKPGVIKVSRPVSPVIKVQTAETVVKVQKVAAAVVKVTKAQGPKGDTGAPGPAGPQNLYVQQAQPAFTGAGLWIELRGDGTVKTMWVHVSTAPYPSTSFYPSTSLYPGAP